MARGIGDALVRDAAELGDLPGRHARTDVGRSHGSLREGHHDRPRDRRDSPVSTPLPRGPPGPRIGSVADVVPMTRPYARTIPNTVRTLAPGDSASEGHEMVTRTSGAGQTIDPRRGLARLAAVLSPALPRASTRRSPKPAMVQDKLDDGRNGIARGGPMFCLDCGAPIFGGVTRCKRCTPRSG